MVYGLEWWCHVMPCHGNTWWWWSSNQTNFCLFWNCVILSFSLEVIRFTQYTIALFVCLLIIILLIQQIVSFSNKFLQKKCKHTYHIPVPYMKNAMSVCNLHIHLNSYFKSVHSTQICKLQKCSSLSFSQMFCYYCCYYYEGYCVCLWGSMCGGLHIYNYIYIFSIQPFKCKCHLFIHSFTEA